MKQAPVPLINHLEIGRVGLNDPSLPVVAKVRMPASVETMDNPWEDMVAIASAYPDQVWEVDPVASGYETAAIIWQHNLHQVTAAMQERIGSIEDARSVMEKLEGKMPDLPGADAEDEYAPGGYL